MKAMRRNPIDFGLNGDHVVARQTWRRRAAVTDASEDFVAKAVRLARRDHGPLFRKQVGKTRSRRYSRYRRGSDRVHAPIARQ